MDSGFLSSLGSFVTPPVDRTMSNMSSKPFHSLRARARYEGTTIWWSLALMVTWKKFAAAA